MALKVLMLTFGRLVRVEAPGRLSHLPEPAVFALNHNNSFESLLVPVTLIYWRGGGLLHFLIDWMFLHIPVIGWVMRQCEPVPVYTKPARFRLGERHRRARLQEGSVVDACLARLAAGGSLGLFPEGTRNQDPGRLLRGRSGLGEIVLRSGVPVVPVGIHYPAAARLGRIPRLGRIVLRIGDPLDFPTEREQAAGDPRAWRDASRRVVARVMAALEELSGKTNPEKRKRSPQTGLGEPAEPRPVT